MMECAECAQRNADLWESIRRNIEGINVSCDTLFTPFYFIHRASSQVKELQKKIAKRFKTRTEVQDAIEETSKAIEEITHQVSSFYENLDELKQRITNMPEKFYCFCQRHSKPERSCSRLEHTTRSDSASSVLRISQEDQSEKRTDHQCRFEEEQEVVSKFQSYD